MTGCEPSPILTLWSVAHHSIPADYQLQLPSQRKIFAIYSLYLLMYAVAIPNPDPNPRGGGQLPNPKSAILR